MKQDSWISPAKAAELAGIEYRTMLRRLHYLNEQTPGGVMRRVGKRKLEVSLEALQRARTTDPELRDAELQGHAAKLAEHDVLFGAMRNAHRALKRRVAALEQRPKPDRP